MNKRTIYIGLTLTTLAGADCVSSYNPKQPEPGFTDDCQSTDLKEKVGFKTVFDLGGEGGKDKGCYKINAGGGQYFEYAALCNPKPGNIECYRSLAGPDKGQIEIQYLSDFMGLISYTSFFRDSSGKIKSPSGAEIPADVETYFGVCERLLDIIPRIPKVCSELQEYERNAEDKK